MRYRVVTLFPELIDAAIGVGLLGKAVAAGLVEVRCLSPRVFATNKHQSVDDAPYGGGSGMVLSVEPIAKALDALDAERVEGEPRSHRLLLTPAAPRFDQAAARRLAALPSLTLICGRYEGFDARVHSLVDEHISLGDFVLNGGEIAALAIIEATARLLPGVIGNERSLDEESHSAGLLEYPQYTRPLELEGKAVPPILTSGNHAAIAGWRRTQAMQRTAARRPDLWRAFQPSPADAKLLAKAGVTPVRARTHVALVHHPVVDRNAKIVTTALTSFDVHDIARSAMTYGLANYHVVTPVTSQRDKAVFIAAQWMGDAQGEHRARALELVRVAASVDEVVAELTARYGVAPIVVASSARTDSFPGVPRRTAAGLVAELEFLAQPMLVLLGTGWGLADALIPSVSRVVAPIEGASDWNHLSVRSAAAILLDRMFGRRE